MSDILKDITPLSAHEYGSPVGTGYIKDSSGKTIVTSVKDIKHVRAFVHAANNYSALVESLSNLLKAVNTTKLAAAMAAHEPAAFFNVMEAITPAAKALSQAGEQS